MAKQIEHIERDPKLLVWADDEKQALRFCGFPEDDLWRVSLEGDHDPRGERAGLLFAVLIRTNQ